jgi:hypothetical protein
MSDIEWREERSRDARRLIALGPGGYKARIEVAGDEVSARLGRPQEDHDGFVVEAHGLPLDEVDATVERLKQEIEQRFEELESGHS